MFLIWQPYLLSLRHIYVSNSTNIYVRRFKLYTDAILCNIYMHILFLISQEYASLGGHISPLFWPIWYIMLKTVQLWILVILVIAIIDVFEHCVLVILMEWHSIMVSILYFIRRTELYCNNNGIAKFYDCMTALMDLLCVTIMELYYIMIIRLLYAHNCARLGWWNCITLG